MKIRMFRFFVLLSLFFSAFSYAANFKLANYLFEKQSQNGFFLGLDFADNNANYYTNYYQMKSILSPENAPYENLSISDGKYSLIYGFRYYLPSKNNFFNRLGFGFKGWYSQQDNSVDRRYVGSGDMDTTYLITSSVNTIGYEGQVHFTLLKFNPNKVNSSIGISLGVGYENKNYNNFHFGDQETEPFNQFKDFKLNSVIYDAALYYIFANHLRVEIGYKLADYASNSQTYVRTIGTAYFTAETEVSPKNKYYYISTSFQF